MKVERFEQAHQLAEGQLVVDAKGELWKAIHYLDDVQLIGFEGVENAFIVDQSGQGRALGPEDDAPLPWLTVKIVPDGEGRRVPEADQIKNLLYERAALRAVLVDREAELLAVKGPCSNAKCRLHYAHSGPCDCESGRTMLPPCPVCGKADWPEGGMHAARSIHLRGHERVTSSTMCGGCGDMQQLMSDATFVPHTSRRTGEPCPGEPGIPTADAAAGWRRFCAGLDQPELWR